MQNWLWDPNETTSPLEVIECHIRETNAGSVPQDAQAWVPCDLQRTARTRGSNTTTYATCRYTRNINDVCVMCVSMHARASLYVQVNEIKLDLKLITVSGFINANLSLLTYLLCPTCLLVFAFFGPNVRLCQNETHSICLWSLCKDKAMHARNLTLKLLHRDYGQLAKGKNTNNNQLFTGFH